MVARSEPTGPRPRKYKIWDDPTQHWEDSLPSDGFEDICARIHPDLRPITDPDISPIMRERLACLTSGDIRSPDRGYKWHDLKMLPSIQMGRDEVSHRVTFTHHPNEESRNERIRRLMAVKCIKYEVLRGAAAMPPHLAALAGAGEIKYPVSPGNLNLNVALLSGDYAATFVYLGDCSQVIAEEKAMDLTIPLAEDKGKLVVWYRDSGALKHVCPPSDRSFDQDPATTGVSFNREDVS